MIISKDRFSNLSDFSLEFVTNLSRFYSIVMSPFIYFISGIGISILSFGIVGWYWHIQLPDNEERLLDVKIKKNNIEKEVKNNKKKKSKKKK